MNYLVIFLFIAIAILIFSIISVSVAPIINNVIGVFSEWGKFNCKYYADYAKYADSLDEKYKGEKQRNLCYRQNGMYGLEYSSFIIDLGVSFLCAQLALLHHFQIGKSFMKITGLIGMIGGGIGFVLTLIYVCFSGYIFNNDTAFKTPEYWNGIQKLYSNGASYKLAVKNVENSQKIYPYSNDKSYDSQYIKYKDLGEKQYNYDRRFFETYHQLRQGSSALCIGLTPTAYDSNCDYYYTKVFSDSKYKYLYDRWCLSLVLGVFIVACKIGLLIFGFLIFKESNDSAAGIQEVKIE